MPMIFYFFLFSFGFLFLFNNQHFPERFAMAENANSQK